LLLKELNLILKDYEEFINDRINGMYNILESSTIYEAANNKRKEDAKRSYLNYLKKTDPKRAKKYEKDPSQMKKDANKNDKALINWVLAHPVAARFIFGNMFVDNVLMANGKK
jgi:hypothetical protein